MSTITITETMPEVITTVEVAEIDATVVDGAILSAVRENKVAQVFAGVNANPNRAWSLGGRID